MDFAGEVKSFISFYGEGEMFDPKYYLMQKRGENDVIYLSVTFGEGYKSYYYQTTDDTIAVNDLVVVPVGTEGKERIVKVKKKEYYKPDAIPMPLDRVKSVIEKFVPPEDGELTFHCPVVDRDIDDDECFLFCLEGFDVPTEEEEKRCDKICENLLFGKKKVSAPSKKPYCQNRFYRFWRERFLGIFKPLFAKRGLKSFSVLLADGLVFVVETEPGTTAASRG